MEAESVLADADKLLAAGQYREAQDSYLVVLLSLDRANPYAFERLVEVRRRLAADDPELLRQEGGALDSAARAGVSRDQYTPGAIRLLATASFIAAAQIEAETAANPEATAGLAAFWRSQNKLSIPVGPVLPPLDAPVRAPRLLAFRLAPDRLEVSPLRPLIGIGVASRLDGAQTGDATPVTARAISSGEPTHALPAPQPATVDAPGVLPVATEPATLRGSCDGTCGYDSGPVARMDGEVTAVTDPVVTLVGVNGSSVRIVLTGATQLGGQKTTVKELAAGDFVRVEGQLTPSGMLLANKLEVLVTAEGRLAESVENIRISGVVAARAATRLSIRIRSGALLDVIVNSATELVGNRQAGGAVAVHDTVSVEGRVEQGTVLARKIRVLITTDSRVEPASEVSSNAGSTTGGQPGDSPASPPPSPPTGGTPDPNAGTSANNSAGVSQDPAQSGQGGQAVSGGGSGSGGGNGGGSGGGNGGGNGGGGNGGNGGGKGGGKN